MNKNILREGKNGTGRKKEERKEMEEECTREKAKKAETEIVKRERHTDRQVHKQRQMKE